MRDVVPRLPQARSRVGVALVDGGGRPFVAGDRLDELEVRVDELRAAGGLDEEGRPLGVAVPEKALTAAMHHASSSSMRETPPPAATTAAAVRHALSTSGNEIRRATTCSGIACRRTVTSVITASVPSEPTSSPVRS